MTKYDKDALDWEYVDRVLGAEPCSWCDEPATIARGTTDARCAEHDAQWFGGRGEYEIRALRDGQVIRFSFRQTEDEAYAEHDRFCADYAADPAGPEITVQTCRGDAVIGETTFTRRH